MPASGAVGSTGADDDDTAAAATSLAVFMAAAICRAARPARLAAKDLPRAALVSAALAASLAFG